MEDRYDAEYVEWRRDEEAKRHDEYYQKLLGDRLRNYRIEAEITELSAQIQEWEEEQESYEFGSYAYDVLNAELECAYAKRSKLEKIRG